MPKSGGVYDLEENAWIKKPNASDIKPIGLDKFSIKDKAAEIMTIIDDMYNALKNEDDMHRIEEIGEDAHYLWKKVKDMRQTSLEKNGESGAGNIVYKILRRMDYLDKLWKLSTLTYDIDKKILEMAERRDFDLANSKKYKSKKIGLDLLNEQLDNLIKKTINESKADTGGNDSPSKNSQNKQCKKKLVKHKIDYDEDNDASLENNNNTISSLMNSDSNNNYDKNTYINEESSIDGDEKELMEFLSKKT